MCEGAFDGVTHGNASNRWEIKGDSVWSKYVEVRFKEALSVTQVQFHMGYTAESRNCKTMTIWAGRAKLQKVCIISRFYLRQFLFFYFSTPTFRIGL